MMDSRVKEIMKALECSEEEARQVIADDDAIDHGEKLFELSDAQKKASKDARQVARGAEDGAKPKAKREKKSDSTKLALMSALTEAVQSAGATDLDIANPEREMTFFVDGKKFKVVLSAPRK